MLKDVAKQIAEKDFAAKGTSHSSAVTNLMDIKDILESIEQNEKNPKGE